MPQRLDDRGWDSAMRPQQAAEILTQSYTDLAGEEALFRALLAERDLDRNKVRFWIAVYERLRPDTVG